MFCTDADFEKLKDKLRSYGDLPPKGAKSQVANYAKVKAASIDTAVNKAVVAANANPAVAGKLKRRASAAEIEAEKQVKAIAAETNARNEVNAIRQAEQTKARNELNTRNELTTIQIANSRHAKSLGTTPARETKAPEKSGLAERGKKLRII